MTAHFVLRALLTLTLISSLLEAAAVGAQEERFERPDVPPLTVVLTPQHIDTDGTIRPVPPKHRFADGDLVAFELLASRGGYVHLAVADPQAEDGLRALWPDSASSPSSPEGDNATGHPVPARQSRRLPPADEPPIRLVGESPTEIFVLFSLRPPDAGSKRRWLHQIEFRGAKRADAPVNGPEPIRFTGEVADGETVRMKVTLYHGEDVHHGEGQASDG